MAEAPMTSPPRNPKHSPAEGCDEINVLETAVLQLLCSSANPRGDWEHVARQLNEYRWQSTDHQIIFDAFGKMSSGLEPLRERLSAATTRMGFPDIDWDHYFDAQQPDADLERAIRGLLHAIKRPE
jgi:hypothetical protein